MKRPPRDSKEPVLTKEHWLAIAGYAVLIGLSVLAVFGFTLKRLDTGTNHAVTISFLTLAFARLWHVFNMREGGSGFFKNEVTRNPFVWGALALCTGLLLAAVYTPGLSHVLQMERPGTTGWLLILGMSLVPWIIGQAQKEVRKVTGRPS